MNLSEEVLSSFSTLTDEKVVNNIAFGFLLRSSFEVVLKQKLESECLKAEELSKVDPIILKQVFAGLISIILEAAKHDADPSTLKPKFEDFNKSPSRLDYFCRVYSEKKTSLRKLLLLTTFQFPHITDVDWTLDYCVKSNSLEKIDTPLYLVNFKTETLNKSQKTPTVVGGGEGRKESIGEESINFTCGVEELQDMVNKLKDALLAVKRF